MIRLDYVRTRNCYHVQEWRKGRFNVIGGIFQGPTQDNAGRKFNFEILMRGYEGTSWYAHTLYEALNTMTRILELTRPELAEVS